MSIVCPKCRYERRASDDHVPDTNCPSCGIAYAKYGKPFDAAKADAAKLALRKRTSSTERGEPEFLSVSTAVLVANCFLVTAVFLLFCLVVIIISAVFKSESVPWLMIIGAVPLITMQAWFGYVVKILIGIYINTSRK